MHTRRKEETKAKQFAETKSKCNSFFYEKLFLRTLDQIPEKYLLQQ